jgi:RNA polymerase sigma-70 factor (ECF subfamily)
MSSSSRMSYRPPAASDGGVDGLDHLGAEFGRLRPRLVGIARRILRNPSEAEDVVQEAWLRWQACDRTRVLDPAAFLVTTTARLAINVTQSARSRRETPVDRWALEPVDPKDDPATAVERRDELEQSLRLLEQRLSGAERTAYVLRQAYDLPYAEIAARLRTSEANARQHVSRAGKRFALDRVLVSGSNPTPIPVPA